MMLLLLFDRDTLFNISSFVDHICGVAKVKERSFDNVGMSFLLSTSIKMIVCYLILKPILQIATENNAIEKNFYDVYSLF
jgi:hypothetical protein